MASVVLATVVVAGPAQARVTTGADESAFSGRLAPRRLPAPARVADPGPSRGLEEPPPPPPRRRVQRAPEPDAAPTTGSPASGSEGADDATVVNQARGGRVLALTFDDGPAEATPAVLDLLDRYAAMATFFVTGRAAQARPDMVRELVARGHQVANHTWNHPDLTRLGADRWDQEVDRTTTLVEELTGRTVTCLRPPYGAHDPAVRDQLADRGLDLAMWTVDGLDWQRPGAPAIASRIVTGFSPGAVILLHDGGGDRSQTVAALDDILSAAVEGGYGFVPACR